ncbi:MAG: hypothetical protein ACKOEG_10285, partial [Chthoniobacterales bacterium]
MTYSPADYLDLEHTDHRSLFEKVTNVWEALPLIASYLQFRLKPAIRGKEKVEAASLPFVDRGISGGGTTRRLPSLLDLSTLIFQLSTPQGNSTEATAMAAMPSPRPMEP